MGYSNEEREMKRIKFAQQRAKGQPIATACAAAGISTSTYYAWNEDDDCWSKPGGWCLGYDKDGGYGKG